MTNRTDIKKPLSTMRLMGLMAVSLLAGALTLTPGCATKRLESGGAYAAAVTNLDGTATVSADAALYAADASFKMVVSSLDAAFAFERKNRAALWSISHDIKHALDAIEPQAADAVKRYAAARRAYLQTPASARSTSSIEGIVTELQSLLATASAAISTKGKS